MSKRQELSEGQKVYCVYDCRWRRRDGALDGQWKEILNIGRKWAYLGPHDRFNMETMRFDGGGGTSPGRVYVSEDSFKKRVRAEAAWKQLHRRLPMTCPEHLSEDDIRAYACKLDAAIPHGGGDE